MHVGAPEASLRMKDGLNMQGAERLNLTVNPLITIVLVQLGTVYCVTFVIE